MGHGKGEGMRSSSGMKYKVKVGGQVRCVGNGVGYNMEYRVGKWTWAGYGVGAQIECMVMGYGVGSGVHYGFRVMVRRDSCIKTQTYESSCFGCSSYQVDYK